MTCFDTNTTSTTFALDVTRLTFDVIILFLVIVTNIAILAVAVRRWSTEGLPLGYVLSSLLVVNLSAADLTAGLSSVFYYLPRYYCALAAVLAKTKNLCILCYALKVLGHLSSGYTLIAIAGDRYLAVFYPLIYQNLTTRMRSLCVIAIIWIFALIGSMCLFVWNTWNGTSCSEASVLPIVFTLTIGLLGQIIIVIVIAVAHWCIHRKVLQIRKCHKFKNGLVSGGLVQRDDGIGTRASRMLALILSVYVISWTPVMTVLILSKLRISVPRVVIDASSSWVNLNYLINPFIYAYNNRTIRTAVLRSVSSFKRKRVYPWNDLMESRVTTSTLDSKL